MSSTREGRLALLTVVTLAVTLLVTAWTDAPADRHVARAHVVRPTQTLASLLSAQEAFSQPARGSTPLGRIGARRPLTGERTVLPVVGAKVGWLHVRLPGRPNGHTGWIRQRGTVASKTRWHIVVETSSRRVVVYKDGRPLRTFRAIVGKASTPTPLGEFFVEESIALRPTDTGAPFALALSARSNVFQQFDGGPGQIALHGLKNVGGVLGTAVSHGCVRLAAGAMHWLVIRIGPGVPVTVLR